MRQSSRMLSAAVISYAGLVGSFVASVVASRLLGVEGKGLFSLFVATITGLSLLATLGVHQGQLFHVSRRPEWLGHFMTNAVPFSLLGGGAAAALYFLGGWALGWTDVRALGVFGVIAGLVVVPVTVLMIFQRQYFLVLHRYELAKVAGTVAVTLPLFGYVALYLVHQTSLDAFLGAFVGSQLVCLVVFQVPVQRLGAHGGGFSPELARQSLGFGLRQLASIFCSYLMGRLDFFIVAQYLGGRGLGIYSVAVSLAEITVRLSNEIGTMLYPAFSGRTLKPGQPAAALRLVTLMAVVAGASMALISAPLVQLLFGPAFAEAVPALRWLVVGTVAWSTTHVTWTYVSATGRPAIGVLVYSIATAVDVLLNVLLLPRLGVIGASIAAATSYIVAALLFLHFFRRTETCSLRQAFIANASDLQLLWKAARAVAGRFGRLVGGSFVEVQGAPD
ncbi:MAG TPA: polysaccharide biosynthesis C-terminal domain-containing protein [Gemmatimonadales bacterium]|nr:polysaccharide biosynthesis C-terminal domain-containing protein [Gemmatimonadales bacterium]